MMKFIKYLYIFVILIFLLGYTSSRKSSKIRINSESEQSSDNDQQIYAFLIPHSHCDLSWVQTYEQYFERNVTKILDNIVAVLSEDPTKKFNWAEIAFFEKWWDEQTAMTQAQVRDLVLNGQLEFVGGGWSQNDEAVTHYQAVLNNFLQGHQFLLSTFGVTPQVGWQIDPFGPSTLTSTFTSLMGFKYHVINRLDDRLKHNYSSNPDIIGSGIMTANKSFEFNWYPSENYGQSLGIFTHILDNHYNSPQLCYPNATDPNITICTGFDFESSPEANPPINETNINERANILVEIIKQRVALYRHNNILLPFGNDFRYQNATVEFENMDKLINYINANASFGVTIGYSLLTEYFEKVLSDVDNDMNHFPSLYAQDYMSYTMCLSVDYQNFNTCANYWAGFYTSYPLLKQTARRSDSLLRNLELLYTLSSALDNGFDYDFRPAYGALVNHRNTSGLMTHHDAITGTSKWYVREYDFDLLYAACNISLDATPQLVQFLLANKSIPVNFSSDPTLLQRAEVGQIGSVSFFNSLAWSRTEFVELPVSQSNIAVFDSSMATVPSQVVQRMDRDGTWFIYFSVEIDPLALTTYFVAFLTGDQDTDRKIMKSDFLGLFGESPSMAYISKAKELESSTTIGNQMFNLNFEMNAQLDNLLVLESYDDLVREKYGIPLSAEFIQYTAMSDDAYKFRPKGLPTILEPENPQSYISEGPLLSVLTIVVTYNNSMTFIVYNSPNGSAANFNQSINFSQFIEIETTVAAGWDQEISLRFSTPIDNNGVFQTSNGLEMMSRNYQEKFEDSYPWSLISGNFYPVINTAQIFDDVFQFTILTEESHSGSSQLNGDFELLLIRRCNYTQWSIHETLNDTSNPTLKFRVLFGEPSLVEFQRTPHSLLLENPIFPSSFYLINGQGPLQTYLNSYNLEFTPIATEFPLNVHLMTLTKLNELSPNIIMRVINLYELDQNPVLSKPISINLNQSFTQLYNFTSVIETTLSATSQINNQTLIPANDLSITLNPIQIKTYTFNLLPNKKNN